MNEPIDILTNNLDKSFSISASAGCGKTYALVARVVALLEKGISIKRMLLLTFSDNAATEMKERIVAELKKHIDEKWALTALEDIHYASISTFHSFSLDVCKTYPEKIGINNQMSLLDELSKEKNQKRFFNQKFSSWGGDKNLQTLITNSYLNGVKRNTWFGFFTNIYENLDFDLKQVTFEIDSSRYESNTKKQLDDIRKTAQEVVDEFETIDLGSLTQARQERLSQFTNLAKGLAQTQKSSELFSIIKNSNKYIGGKGFSLKKHPLDIDSKIENLGEKITASISNIADSTLRLGAALLLNAAQEFREESILRGFLTFSDAILGAKKILQNEADSFEIWQKYDCIIVDEFQDTDPHQLEIIKALSGNTSHGDIGRLFVVGDHKQSIYGFRGVEVEKYSEFVASSELSSISLDISRRTTKSIIENVNKIMPNLIKDYDEMTYVRENYAGENYPHFSTMGSGLALSTPDIRKLQGQEIAARIPELLGVEIQDKYTNELRKSSYDDITILLRDRSGLSDLLTSLQESNIPFSVDSPSLIFDNRFTQMVMICLKAIAEPKNSIAIIGALKSPLLRCSNNDLLDFVDFIEQNRDPERYIENYWNPSLYSYISFEDANENIVKVRNGISSIAQLNIESKRKELVTFLVEVFFEHHLAMGASFANTENATEVSDIVKVLISKAINFAGGASTRTLLDFVQQLEYERVSSRSNDKISLETNSDVVHILTAHSSKGLEFPIVIYVPSLKRENSNRTSKMYLISSDAAPTRFLDSIALYGSKKFKDSRLDEYFEEKSEIEIVEEARIAYVGLTRARDYLVICTHHKISGKDSKPTKSGAFSLAQAIDEANLDLKEVTNLNVLKAVNIQEPKILHDSKTAASLRDKKILKKKEIIVDLTMRIEENRVLSPGGTEDDKIPDKRFSKSPRDKTLGPAIGRAVHRSLNLIDFKGTDEHISTICTSCAYDEGIVSNVDEVIKYVKKALTTETILNLSSDHFREVPIVGELNGKTYSGYIDLLIEYEDHFLIVDYKTDSISKSDSVQSKVEKYTNQLLTYSLLLKQNVGNKTIKAMFLFLDSPDQIEYEIDNLNDLDLV